MSKIILIRHGQASFGSANYDKLSEKGMEQSETLGKYFANKNIVFDKIYMGTLLRHKETFEGFNKAFTAANIQLPAPIATEGFNEHFGQEKMQAVFEDFVGKYEFAQSLFKEMQENPKVMRKNSLRIFEFFMKEYTSGRYETDDTTVQSWKAFRAQAKKGIADVLKDIQSKEIIGIFTSGGTTSSIVGDSLGVTEEKIAELNYVIKNTSFSQILVTKNKFNLLSLNETPHLTDEHVSFI